MMIRIFVLSIILITSASCNGQIVSVQEPTTCKCDVSVFTLSDPEFDAKVSLSKNGFNIMTLRYPMGEENEESIFFFKVNECDEGWLKIDFSNGNGDLWFEPERLGIVSRRSTFKLYQDPSKEREYIYESTQQKILTIMGCEGNWALVNFRNKAGKLIRGWIHPEDQCDNPYTTCP